VTGVSRFKSLVGEFYNPYLCSAPQSDGERKPAVALGFLSTYQSVIAPYRYLMMDNTWQTTGAKKALCYIQDEFRLIYLRYRFSDLG